VSLAKKLAGQINKAAGSNIAASGRDKGPADIPGYISTGCFPVDVHLGKCRFRGGWPLGRIVEVFGRESSGKSTLATQAMISAQRGRVTLVEWRTDEESKLFLPEVTATQTEPGVAFLLDPEEGWYKDRAQEMGLDVDALVPLLQDHPEPSVEDCFEAISHAIDTIRKSKSMRATPVVIVFDTIAAVDSAEVIKARVKAKEDNKSKGTRVGSKARSVSQQLRMICTKIAHQQISLIIVNQTIEKIGVQFGSPETTPGGRALKHYAAIRAGVTRLGPWKEGTRVVGINSRLYLKKSKVCAPDLSVDMPLRFGTGVDCDLAVAQFVTDKKRGLFAPPSKKGAKKSKSRKPPAPLREVKVKNVRKYRATLPDGTVVTEPYTRRRWSKALDAHPGLREHVQEQLLDAMRRRAVED
jgi:recombination protein RecA